METCSFSEPGGYSPWAHKESGMTEELNSNNKIK